MVHRVLLYQADATVSGTPTPCGAGGGSGWRLVTGWAPGGKNFELPPESVFAEEAGTTRWALQVHYNNAQALENQVDETGFDLCLTGKLRAPRSRRVATRVRASPSHRPSYRPSHSPSPDAPVGRSRHPTRQTSFRVDVSTDWQQRRGTEPGLRGPREYPEGRIRSSNIRIQPPARARASAWRAARARRLRRYRDRHACSRSRRDAATPPCA